MFKKIAGLFLAAAVMCSSAAITASAAEAEDDAAVAAADQSGEVSADGSSEVSADASSEVEAGNVGTLIVKDYCAIIGLNQKDLENQGILA